MKKTLSFLFILLVIVEFIDVSEAAFEGTIGTRFTLEGSGFGNNKPQVYIQYEKRPGVFKKINAEVDNYSDSLIACHWKQKMPTGTYNLFVQPGIKGTPPIQVGIFNIMNPSIENIAPEKGLVGRMVAIQGHYFSTNKLNLYLQVPPSQKKTKCKISNFSMDPDTGLSSLSFIVPKSTSGEYSLILENGIGQAIGTLTVMASEELAFQHLKESMDKFQETFNVYTDLSDAGNHFVVFGEMSSSGDEDKVQINPSYTGNCFSGTSCIENRFYSRGNNWGGFRFLSGILTGTNNQPIPNWGDYPNTGIDLSGATTLTFWAKGAVGGEKVQFVALGIGRDQVTGNPLKSYPDSSIQVSSGFVTLTNQWVQYTIDLTGKDLSYIISGFGWLTNAPNNNNQDIIFYLDDIKYNKSRLDDPRFIVSYETLPSSLDFDTIMKNTAFAYDNALALITFLSRGTQEDMNRAQLLADAFVFAINNDRYYTDGRLRNAYQGGDLIQFPGWAPNDKNNTVRTSGWWNPVDLTWHEDRYQVSSYTGNQAWVIIALLSYYEKAKDNKYLDAAITIGKWIENETRDDNEGYTSGFDGWEPNPDKLPYKSTEHNIAVYVAFSRLSEATSDSTWQERALHAKVFVESMWDESGGKFWIGTDDSGVNINKVTHVLDIQALAILAFRENLGLYSKTLNYANKYHKVGCGFDFNDDKDGIWYEGTSQMAIAYQIIRKEKETIKLLKCIEGDQLESGFIPSASKDGLTTGLYLLPPDNSYWIYYHRGHVAATAWYLLAKLKVNPFWLK